MTWREEISKKSPWLVDTTGRCLGHMHGCPPDTERFGLCNEGVQVTHELCTRCWDREIPEIEKPFDVKKENKPVMELKIKDSASLNMIVEALSRNGYHLEIATKWKEWPQNGIDCFCILAKEKEEV